MGEPMDFGDSQFVFTDRELNDLLGAIESQRAAGVEGELEVPDFLRLEGKEPLALQFQPHYSRGIEQALDASRACALVKEEMQSVSQLSTAMASTQAEIHQIQPSFVDETYNMGRSSGIPATHLSGPTALMAPFSSGIPSPTLGVGYSPFISSDMAKSVIVPQSPRIVQAQEQLPVLPQPATLPPSSSRQSLPCPSRASVAASRPTAPEVRAGAAGNSGGNAAGPRDVSGGSGGGGSGSGHQISHSTVEKQRRDRINSLIDELRELVPPQRPQLLRSNNGPLAAAGGGGGGGGPAGGGAAAAGGVVALCADGGGGGGGCPCEAGGGGGGGVPECRRPKHVVLADTIALLKHLQRKLQVSSAAPQEQPPPPEQPHAAAAAAAAADRQQQREQEEERERNENPHQPQQRRSRRDGSGGAREGGAAEEDTAHMCTGGREGSSSQEEAEDVEMLSGAPRMPHIPCHVTENAGVTVERGPDCYYVQVKCRDRTGLLSDIINALRQLPLEIRTASVTTTNGIVRDVFEVRLEGGGGEAAAAGGGGGAGAGGGAAGGGGGMPEGARGGGGAEGPVGASGGGPPPPPPPPSLEPEDLQNHMHFALFQRPPPPPPPPPSSLPPPLIPLPAASSPPPQHQHLQQQQQLQHPYLGQQLPSCGQSPPGYSLHPPPPPYVIAPPPQQQPLLRPLQQQHPYLPPPPLPLLPLLAPHQHQQQQHHLL
ncbi:hypothetical protein Agub_g2455, partial [Astrephomene gubernaculifera]